MNTDGNRGTVGLFSGDPFNVDDELLTINRNDLANLLRLIMSTDYLHFIILADW